MDEVKVFDQKLAEKLIIKFVAGIIISLIVGAFGGYMLQPNTESVVKKTVDTLNSGYITSSTQALLAKSQNEIGLFCNQKLGMIMRPTNEELQQVCSGMIGNTATSTK